MRRVCRRGGLLAAPSAVRVAAVTWMDASYTAPSTLAAATAATTTGAVTTQRGRHASSSIYHFETRLQSRAEQRHEWAVAAGSGSSSPALFRPTRIARIPPQLLRIVITGVTALLQVFVVAYSQESKKVRQGQRTGRSDGSGQATSTRGLERDMLATEAVQILGLDRSFPDLFATVQQAEASGAARSSFASSLPLQPGKAREAARQNFDRMFALAVKEDNMFLAGKLSAAYRVCVDPTWDYAAAAEDAGGASATDAGPGQQGHGGPTA